MAVAELLAAADTELAAEAVTTTESMTIVESATAEATTAWSAAGMDLTLGNTVTSGITADASATIVADVATPARLSVSSDGLIQEATTVLGYEPIVPNATATAIEGELSSVFTSAQNEVQAAQLESTSTWTISSALKLVGKVAMYTIGVAMALDWIGKKLVSIIQLSIEAANPPPWAQSLTAAQKQELKSVTSAIPQLSILMQGWHAQWSTYSKSFANSLGSITANVSGKTTSVQVLYIIYYAFSDMEGVSNTIIIIEY